MRLPFFVGGSYVSRSSVVDPEECVNWCVETMEAPGAKAKQVHYPTPGFTSYCATSIQGAPGPGGAELPMPGVARGMVGVDAAGGAGAFTQCYTVIGEHLYRLGLSAGSVGRRLSQAAGGAAQPMLADSRPVSMAFSGPTVSRLQLLIASGGAGYVYDSTGAPAWNPTPVLSDTLGIVQVGYLGSFFVALDNDTTLRVSAALNASTWDPTQILRRSTQGDPWVALMVIHDQLWMLGTRTTDVFWNAGTAPFPFRPIDGVSIQQGIAATYSIAALDNAPIWLAQSTAGTGIVVRAQGYTPQRVSTFAMEATIAQYSTISDAVGTTFLVDGHWFYLLTFPTADDSWLYDASNQQWTHLREWNPTTAAWQASRIACHCLANGFALVGDRQSGVVYSMSTSVSTDMNGAGIRRMRRTPVLTADGVRLFFQRLQVDLEPGLGVLSGQGSDPQVMVRWSDNGGKTWSQELWRTAGARGQYGTRAQWFSLGSGRNRVFEIVVSDPVPWRLSDAFIDVDRGES